MRIYENKGSKRRFLPTVARSDYFAAMGLLAFILKESDVPSGMRPVTRTFLWSRSALPITALLERIIAYRKNPCRLWRRSPRRHPVEQNRPLRMSLSIAGLRYLPRVLHEASLVGARRLLDTTRAELSH